MNDLHEIGLKGRLPIFVQNFLSNREFKVRVGSTLSEAHNQEQGVPQGSILSLTLFSLKINNIVKCLNPGADCSLYVDNFLICYRSKNMNTIERQLQLNLNDIWETGNVPKSWKEATIIPIPKPGKDNMNPNNCRPIALTSCICKTLERMINERLVWYLEKNNIITEFQSGFRHQRSTNDHLVRLETFIREAFIKKEHLVAVFF